MRRLNVKLVVLLSTISVVAVVLVAVVHGWQMKRTARVLLVRAKEAQTHAEESDDDKDLELAASLYQQYVAYRPEDAEEGAQMALLMADLAEKPGASKQKRYAAYAALEEQLRRHTERDDVRSRLVDSTMFGGRYGDAIDHINELLKKTPDDAELLTKLGTCNFVLDNNHEAEQRLQEAISKDPHQIQAFDLLATVFRERLNSPAQADEIIDRMVELNPQDPKARLARVRYVAKYFKEEEGRDVTARVAQRKDDVKRALELAPDEPDSLLYAATVALEEGKTEEARRLLEHAQIVDPENAGVVQYLIALDMKEEKYDDIDKLLKGGPKTEGLQQIDFELKLHNRDLAGAKKILVGLEEDPEASRPLVEFMRAELDFHEMKWMQASKELERLRLVLPSTYHVRIDLMLGRCYDQLREHDLELQAYERAANDPRGGVPAHAGLAMALMKIGKTDRALSGLQMVKKHQGVDQFVQSEQARSALLTLLLQRNSALPEGERDWTEIDEIVAATAKAFPGSKELLLIESSVREHKGDHVAARQILREAIEKAPSDPLAWLSLARLEFLDSGPAAALKLLDEAQEKVGDVYSTRQTRVVYALQLPAEEAKETLAAMSQGLEKFNADEQDRLRRIIGIGYFRIGDLSKARAIWTKIAEAKPNDPEAQFTLFDISVREGDDAAISDSVEKIKNLFKAGSAEAKFVEARRLVTKVRANKSGDSQAALTEARQLVNRAAEQRPRWAILARFEGEIDLLEGRSDDAITHLQRAIEFGDTDVATARQIAQLLVSRGRGEEARGYMQLASARNLNGDTAASDMLEVSIAMSESDIPKAVKLLESAREREPDDVQKIVLLGQLLPQLGRDEDAEQLLRGLVDTQPQLPLGWFELVRYLKLHQREDDARAVIAQAEVKLPKEEVDLAVGQCYELIGDLPNAEKSFVKAHEGAADDLGVTRALATFYVRSKQTEKAREELTRLVQSEATKDSDREHIAWANRELAVIIAASGSYSDFQRAMAQLTPKNGKGRVTLADKVAMARLLANRPEADSRMEATRILEEIKSESPLPSDAQLILARLYEVTGNWPECRDEMLSLVGKNKDNATYIATFVEMLMRNNDQDAATLWMDRLEEIAPEALTTGALKARLLVMQGKPEEAVATLRNLLPRPMPREKLGMLVDAAKLLEQLEQYDAAESMYREFVAIDPSSILVLAGFLGRHGSLKDSLDLCQRALESPTIPAEQVIRQALASLRAGHSDATKEDFGRVEGWVTKAIARNNKQLILQLEYAELLDLEGRYAELEEFYEKLLKTAEMSGVQRALVLNNLAYLLAVQNRAGDSRKFIDEAVQILGPQSDLLDTRALVHLAHGELKQAVEDLNMSVVDQPTGTKYFHLARAYQMGSNSQSAQDAFKKAIDDYELKMDDLPRLEQSAFRQLSEQLGSN
ncbi:MAG TPA: tetratricopeptide repeat protein [Pirellulales bacterium]|jgi:tetratricopeptide (TPR) repeat protein